MIKNKINQFLRKTIAIIGTDHIINDLRKPNRYLVITITHKKIPTIFINIKIIHHHHSFPSPLILLMKQT